MPRPSSIATSPTTSHERKQNYVCIVVILAATLISYGPAIFEQKVLLPADIVPLMAPWAASSRKKFPEFRFAQNQLHGPIFEYYSWRHYARERMRVGEIPLWNPYELSGNILLANSQSAVLYPPNILLYLLPLWQGINVGTALHMFLTGLFMFYLLRLLGMRAPPALTGALVWMFCGLQTVWTEFQTPTAVLCWLPALLLTWELYHQGRGWRWALLGSGGACAMTLLAGHLHFAFYCLLAFTLYAFWRTFGSSITQADVSRSASNAARISSSLGLLAAALGFGILLSAATFLPVIEMARLNFRGNAEYASSIALRLPPENLLTLIQPNLFGNPRDYVRFDASGAPANGNPYWGKFDFIEYTAYVGVPAIILAVYFLFDAVYNRKQNKPTDVPKMPINAAWFFATLAAIGLLLALGTPLCALFYYLVPGYKQFNATARALCLFSFGISAMAGWGLERVMTGIERQTNRGITRTAISSIGLVCVIGLIAFPGMGLLWQLLFTDDWFSYEGRGLRHFILFAALTGLGIWLTGHRKLKSNIQSLDRFGIVWFIPIIAALDLFIWGHGFNPAVDPAMLGYPTMTTEFLQSGYPARTVSIETPGKGIKSFIVPNYNVVDHLREVQGADSLHTRRYHQFMSLLLRALDPSQKGFGDPNTIHFPSPDHRIFDLLNVRYISNTSSLDPSRFPVVNRAEMQVSQNPRAFGPAWVVGSVENRTTPEDSFARISDPLFDPKTRATVEERVDDLDPRSSGSPVTLNEFTAHRLRYEVDSRDRGLLVMSEPYFPGWRASVDGSPTRIIAADYLLRGVPIMAGKHRVEITYDPSSYRTGLFLTCICVAISCACIAFAIPRRNGLGR